MRLPRAPLILVREQVLGFGTAHRTVGVVQEASMTVRSAHLYSKEILLSIFFAITAPVLS